MRREDIRDDLAKLAFDFFYRYSRFEFALKEHRFLRDHQPGRPATPDWYEFARARGAGYRVTAKAAELLRAAPKRQIVAANGDLEWRHVDLNACPDDLHKVIRLLQTIRNNLFHGGKHGAEGWDDPERTKSLLDLGAAVLEEIAQQTAIDGDYFRYY